MIIKIIKNTFVGFFLIYLTTISVGISQVYFREDPVFQDGRGLGICELANTERVCACRLSYSEKYIKLPKEKYLFFFGFAMGVSDISRKAQQLGMPIESTVQNIQRYMNAAVQQCGR
jgi:hypothetical protein